jgi:hypothetical protein
MAEAVRSRTHNLFFFWLLVALLVTGSGLPRLILLLHFALLSKLVAGLASVVCVPVSTAHRSNR